MKSNNYSLLWKLTISFIILLVLNSMLIVYLFFNTSLNYERESNQKLNKNIASQIVKDVTPLMAGAVYKKNVQEIMHYLMAINPSIQVYVLDPVGNILTYVAPKNTVVRTKVDLNPLKTFIKSNGNNYVEGDDPRDSKGKNVFSAAPVIENNKLIGYVYVILASNDTQNLKAIIQNSYFFKMALKYIFIIIFISLLTGFLIFWFLTKNINDIVTVFKKYSAGDLTARSTSKGNSDFSILSETFNEMAEKITAFLKNAQPQVLLTQPIDGQIIGNILQVAGSIIDDEADPLLVIKLRDLEIYRGVGTQFSTSFDMSSLPLGSYTLTLLVTPKTGSSIAKTVQVNYQSLTTTTPEYVYGLGENNYVQGVNQNNVLFTESNTGNVFLYQPSTAQKQLVIEKSKIDYLQVKQVVGKRVLLLGQDIVSKQYQVYLWDNGLFKNISEISGDNKLSSGYQENPVMSGSWIVWSSGSSQRYHLYNVDTQESHIIAKPSYSPYIGNWNYSLVVLADTVRFYTWMQTGTFGADSHFDIFQYDTKTKETIRITNNGLLNIYPQANITQQVQ